MSVKIRLTRTGKKHQISYRIVAQDTRTKRDGKFLEMLGYYLPYRKDEKGISVKKDRLTFWITKGATLTPAVTKLIRILGSQAIGTPGHLERKNPTA